MDSVCALCMELTYLCPPGLCSRGHLALFLLLVAFIILSIQTKMRLKSFTWSYQILVSTVYLL